MSADRVDLKFFTARIVRCPDCTDDVNCPLNQLKEKVEIASKLTDLDLLTAKVNIQKIDSGVAEDEIGPGGRYVIYQCQANANERGRISIKTKRD